MNIQKKRVVVYFLFIIFGFLAAYLFLRKKNTDTNTVSTETIVKKDSIVVVSLFSEFIGLENNGEAFVTSTKAASGTKSCMFSENIEFGVGLTKLVKDIPSSNNLKNISIRFKGLFEKGDPDALYVLSIDNKEGKNIFWDGKPIVHNKSMVWTEQALDFKIAPEFLIPENKIAVYPWNRNKKVFYLDDITVDYIGTAAYKAPSANHAESSNLFFDFETEAGLSAADNVKETTAHSGKRACDLSGGKEYGPSINKKLSEIGSSFPVKISLSVWIYPLTDKPNTLLVVSAVNSKNETVFWDGEGTENKSFPKNTWTKINASFTLPVEKFNPDDVLGVSIWNKGKTGVVVDDIEIVYGESAERRGEKSTVDPISIYEKRFKSEKNKPPFKTIYFEKQEIGNELNVFSSDDFFAVGNFNNDEKGIDEILCIGKNKQAMYTYDQSIKGFKKIWENKIVGDQMWDKDNFYMGSIRNGKTSIIIQSKNKSEALILNFDGKNWNRVEEQKVIPPPSSSTNSVCQYSGKYTADKNQVLKLDISWRFDLKLIENDVVLGNVDFKGYPNDYNPKYYEFVKLVPGNFLSKNQTSLLVVMCNCADANFSGEKCNQIEDLPFLPNSVQLYNFSPQITQIITDKN